MSDNAPPLITNDDSAAALCTLAGDATADHDYRPFTAQPAYPGGRVRTYWRCVWCHAVACGNYGEADPCWLPYHHHAAHRSRGGVTWPLGGSRNEWMEQP